MSPLMDNNDGRTHDDGGGWNGGDDHGAVMVMVAAPILDDATGSGEQRDGADE